MVQTKLTIAAATVLLLCSCSEKPSSFTWNKIPVDGHRTGVTAPNAVNVPQALGMIEDGKYTSPNGNVYTEGSATYAVAANMLEVQPRMSSLKEVIAQSAKEMLRYGPECELGDWTVDHYVTEVERLTGKKVDLAFANLGGIRVDMPKGDVMLDDIVSMFPFKNYLCYVAIKGEEVLRIFTQMAEKSVQPFSGAKLVVTDHKIDTLLVGGKPVDPNRIYGVATIDFLLDGGDGFNIARNAKEIIITDVKVIDAMLPYAKSYAAQGKMIDYSTDGRAVVHKTRKK